MVIGTSLTFYRGPEAHEWLLGELRRRTGLPVSTMSQAIIDGLREMGAKRVAVATAYSDVVNRRLKELLAFAGIDTLALDVSTCSNSAGRARRARPTSLRSAAAPSNTPTAPRGYSFPAAVCARWAWPNRSKPTTAFRSCRRPRRRSGRPCALSATAGRSAATAVCSKQRARRLAPRYRRQPVAA